MPRLLNFAELPIGWMQYKEMRSTMQQQPTSFQRDFSWQDGYMPEVQRILQLNAIYLFNVSIASWYQDVKQATDMTITLGGKPKSVGVRLRRSEYGYRDLTIRAVRSSGARTELEKIMSGMGDAYLYGWTHGFQISEWMLIDLNRLRGSGLLEGAPIRRNRDAQTSFISITYLTLREYGCVLNANMRVPR